MLAVPLENLWAYEAEDALVSSALSCIGQAEAMRVFGLRPEHFSERSRQVYLAMEEMIDAKIPIDEITVGDWMRPRGAGLDQFRRIASINVVLVDSMVESYCRILDERLRIRTMCEASTRVLQMAASGSGINDILDIYHDSEKACRRSSKKECADVIDIVSKYQDGDIKSVGVFCDANSCYDVHSPSLVTVAARPSMGKTSFSLYVALRLSLSGGIVSLHSIEETEENLRLRLLSAISGVQSTRMKMRGELGGGDWKKIAAAKKILDNNKNLMFMCGPKTHRRLIAEIKECAESGVGVMVIDHLQLVSGYDRSNMNQAIAGVTQQLAEITREHNVVIFLLSQLNRDIERRDVKRPQLSDLRDSGSIEQDSDCVWFVHRPAFYSSSENAHKASIIIRKNRHGPIGEVQIPCHMAYGAWGEFATPLIGDSIWETEEE